MRENVEPDLIRRKTVKILTYGLFGLALASAVGLGKYALDKFEEQNKERNTEFEKIKAQVEADFKAGKLIRGNLGGYVVLVKDIDNTLNGDIGAYGVSLTRNNDRVSGNVGAYTVDLLDDISSQIVSGHFGGFDVKISRKGNIYSGYRGGFDVHLNETENETTGNIGNFSVNLEGGHKRYLVPLLLPPPPPIIPILPPPPNRINVLPSFS